MARKRGDEGALDAGLSRRERQIIRILYRKGSATVRDVTEAMPDAPSYNSVRVTLGILERKGKVRHEEQGRRYVYFPTIEPAQASQRAVRDVLTTFFRKDPSKGVLAMLDEASTRLSDEQLDEIEAWIQRSREGSAEDG